ncbi:MAG: HNH endonuclease [Roseiflexaceae bacterium]|nr:HNH endonuclease [Roseiflexaceae bacterium]
MRFRSHLIASSIAAVMLYPRAPWRAALVVIAGTIIDVDHLVLYASRSGDTNPLGAIQYDRRRVGRPTTGDTRPRYGPLRSVIHNPLVTLPLVWGAARLVPALTPLAQGLTLHLAMDTPWKMLLDLRVWRRSGGICERCGERRRSRQVYHHIIPKDGGAIWALENRVLWCERCAKAVRKRQGFTS